METMSSSNNKMPRPSLIPTSLRDEHFGGVTYHLEGDLVPVLTIELDNTQSIYFEHHILLWKNTQIEIGLKQMKGVLKRLVAGMQVFITEARGNGQIAFSRDGPGQILPIHLRKGDEIQVREHQFLAATQNIDYTFERVSGAANMLFGGTGFFVDKFHGHEGDGIVWLHGYGNVFEKVLDVNEQIEVEPGGWLYKDVAVKMETKIQRLTSGLFGGVSIIVNRFTGPGRVAIQSMYLHFATSV